MKKRKRDREIIQSSRGVTIFEVLIALALFAIIITPVMRSFVTAIKVNQKSRDTMIATDVANSIMEGIQGKTYEEVVAALVSSPSGFNSSVGDSNSSAKLALSSINDNWYNLGNSGTITRVGGIPASGKKALNSANPALDGDYTGDYATSYTVGTDNCFPIDRDHLDDQAMCRPAIQELYTFFDVTKPKADYDTDKYDKLLYFGFSSSMFDPPDATTKGIPKMAYMVYSRIERENHYYDATVTFVPRAQDYGVVTATNRIRTGESSEAYFAYEVTIKVYEYHYDAMSGTWSGRFDATGRFDGAPSATVTGGILNKSINK